MEDLLQSILINTYNQDSHLRQEAELALSQFLKRENALVTLLIYIGNVNNHKELRLATGILIKNKLRDFWTVPASEISASYEQKVFFKTNLLIILSSEENNAIRGLLAESVKIIAEFDYPHGYFL
jgi:hypothetical protein